MLNAQCPMPNAQCSNAQCSNAHGKCQMPNAQMLNGKCQMPYGCSAIPEAFLPAEGRPRERGGGEAVGGRVHAGGTTRQRDTDSLPSPGHRKQREPSGRRLLPCGVRRFSRPGAAVWLWTSVVRNGRPGPSAAVDGGHRCEAGSGCVIRRVLTAGSRRVL